MTLEQEYFLTLLKNHIHGEKTDSQDGIDWTALLECARAHQLTAIVYDQCKEYIPEAVLQEYKIATAYTVSVSVKRKRISKELIDRLNGDGVSAVLIKGQSIAEYYPKPEFRTMTDTDILVSDRDKTHKIMLELGFENMNKDVHREWQYMSSGGIEYEIHDRLVYEEAVNSDAVTKFLADFRKYIDGNRLDESYHFIFLLSHLRKHLMNSGVGIRHFVDFAVMIKNSKNLDWQKIDEWLNVTGMKRYASVVFAYVEKWFGVSAPLEKAEIDAQFYGTAADFIMSNGVFGSNNTDNKKFNIANCARNSKHPKLYMFGNAVRKFFPSYKSMTRSDKYAFLRGRPYLLPVAWIYRFVRILLFVKADEGTDYLMKSFVSKEYIAKRELMFEHWGLGKNGD